jgi:hypothetical protein
MTTSLTWIMRKTIYTQMKTWLCTTSTMAKPPLHVFNHIIKELQGIHNEISKEKATKQRNEVRRISQPPFQLKQVQNELAKKNKNLALTSRSPTFNVE